MRWPRIGQGGGGNGAPGDLSRGVRKRDDEQVRADRAGRPQRSDQPRGRSGLLRDTGYVLTDKVDGSKRALYDCTFRNGRSKCVTEQGGLVSNVTDEVRELWKTLLNGHRPALHRRPIVRASCAPVTTVPQRFPPVRSGLSSAW